VRRESDPASGFTWRDAERIVIFRSGALAEAPRLLAEHAWEEYDLLSTHRAMGEAPHELQAVGSVHVVPEGPVPEAAKRIMTTVRGTAMVALGGGRVIDTAKAIAAVHGGRVCAIPTTLSGAEMTRVHRLPPGHEGRALVRPALVIADPEVMASQPEFQLRASAMNALAHGAEALYTPLANPVAELTALRGAALIAAALDADGGSRDRAALALGSILCAYAMDSAGFALHHVLCQTLVRVCGTSHAQTNAAMLPPTIEAMRGRAPDAVAALAEAIGAEPEGIGQRLRALAGDGRRLGELGAERARLEQVVEAALARPQLELTPEPPGREELVRILEAAW
jgi:alcohol dehydrogenase class IV